MNGTNENLFTLEELQDAAAEEQTDLEVVVEEPAPEVTEQPREERKRYVPLAARLAAIGNLCHDPETRKARIGHVVNPIIFSGVAVTEREILFALGVDGVEPKSELGKALQWVTSATRRNRKFSALAFGSGHLRRELGKLREQLCREVKDLGIPIHSPYIPVETLRRLLNERYDGYCVSIAERCRATIADLERYGVEIVMPTFGLDVDSPTPALKAAHQKLLRLDRELAEMLADAVAEDAAGNGRNRLRATVGERMRRSA